MQSVVSKGPTVSEAIESGLAILETTKKEVEIEVIQQAERKLWGLRKVPAVVKLSMATEKAAPVEETANRLSADALLDRILEEHPASPAADPAVSPHLRRRAGSRCFRGMPMRISAGKRGFRTASCTAGSRRGICRRSGSAKGCGCTGMDSRFRSRWRFCRKKMRGKRSL
ncbi:Jag N-terminal domain-containing protein [Indiicoccus explosivorum]|uniref:Jag N-terminal domain-containing protein n=1 Tax=Indiicoccus explosivorum TaxID=1917864 RepID=UPI0013905B66|nr:Jag N-terminal domain-containing protein [Indiicoccus explosivorum]